MIRKLLGQLAAAVLIATGFVALPSIPAPQAQAAPPGSSFDPGLIISDSVFYDFGSMTLGQIQAFLDSRVSSCRATDPAVDCLKNYKMDIPETPATGPKEVGPCKAIAAKSGASAAEVIYEIANACGINPKVLIVTLQKEQGLVSSTKPTEYMYRAAMGFGCPDSDPAICGKVYVGLFNQMYRAAKQFRWYGNPEGSFTYWKPGRTVSMRYNPKSSCGSTSFPMKSQATANLYYYTPYTPNQAALSNLYGTGDSCSAYGNRNFWRFFHDWFGSPIGGAFLLKAEGSETFLIVDDKKYRVPDARLSKTLTPLGPLGEISQAYLDSFVTAGDMTQLVKATDGSYFLLVDGVKYKVADCSVAQQFGQSCDLAVTLTNAQLNLFVSGTDLTRLVESGGTKYWIENGKSRAVVDDLALATVGAQAVTPTKLVLEQLVSVSAGPALASELLLFGLVGSEDRVLVSQGVAYRFAATLVSTVPLTTWFQSSNARVEQGAITANQVLVRGFVKDASGSRFVLTSSGKLKVTDPENWLEEFTALPDSILNLIPLAQGELSAPAMVTFPDAKTSYIVLSGERRTMSNSTMTSQLLSLLGQPSPVVIPHAAVASIKSVGPGFAPGSLIKANGSSTLYLVDGLDSKVQLSSETQARNLTKAKVFSFDKSLVSQLKTRKGPTSNLVQCGGGNFLVDNAVLYPISPEVAAEYPGKPYQLEVSTCAALTVSSKPAGQFIRSSSKRYFLVEDGKKRAIQNFNAYKAFRTEGPAFVTVSTALLNSLPNGTAVSKAPSLVPSSNVPSGVFSDIIFTGEVSPTPSPTPTPTPSPTKTPSPSPSATKTPTATPAPSPTATPTPTATAVTYTVKSGDTLSGIASRFKVTMAFLQQLNGITDPSKIRIGQVLKITADPASPSPTPTATPSATPTPTPTPSPSPTVTEVDYRVQSGDSLLRIANKFGVSVAAIQERNKISNPNLIRIGQLLKIPVKTN